MPTCSKCSDADLGRVCPHRQTLLITGEALDNFYAWVREAQQLRSTLADLIAEQRELHHRMGFACSLCVTEWPCQCTESLDRAEERLREVTGGDRR